MSSSSKHSSADNSSAEPKSKHKHKTKSKHNQDLNPSLAEQPLPSPPPSSPPNPKKIPKSTKLSSPMTFDASSTDVSKPQNAKRKARELDGDGGGAVKSSGDSARRRSFEDYSLAILRGAIEFKRRTGAVPTKSTSLAFYEVVKDSIGGNLSDSQVFTKLRHLREKLNQSNGKDDPVRQLSVELWQVNSEKPKKEEKKEKKEKKEKDNYVIAPRDSGKTKNMEVDSEEEEEEEDEQVENKKKAIEEADGEEDEDEEDNEETDAEEEAKQEEKVDKKMKMVMEENGKERVLALESFHYVKEALAEYWKDNGLPSVTLEEGLKLVDLPKARALEEKWKRYLNDEMKLLTDWSKMSWDLLVMLQKSHKDFKI